MWYKFKFMCFVGSESYGRGWEGFKEEDDVIKLF